MAKYRILTIDGGGLRGLLAIKILQDLEKKTGRRISEMFDFIGGTSTGALIALGLTYKDPNGITLTPAHSLKDLEDLYTQKGERIFPHSKNFVTHNFLKGWSFLFRRFSSKGLKKVLSEHFPTEARLADCIKHLLITTYDINSGEPIFFKTRHALTRENNVSNALIHDICLATSAAPTFLPTHEMNYWDDQQLQPMGLIDGGVFMNNPSIAALVEVLKYPKFYTQEPEISLNDIYLMSVGTGKFKKPVGNLALKAGGKLFWATPAINILMKGTSQAVDYQCQELLNSSSATHNNYIRLDVDLMSGGKLHEDMADSRPKSREFWITRFEEDYMKNDSLHKEINQFLTNAEMFS